MNVGKNLQMIREINNFTQSYVAEKLGINQKTYSLLEKAENNVSIETLLSKILELNADTIMTNHSQQGGVSYINNQATFYNGEKEMFQQLITSQAELIKAQQIIIQNLQTTS